MATIDNLRSIKNYNERLLLKQIYLYGPISRIELSKRLDLSPTAVSDLTKDLLNKELIVDNTVKLSGNNIGAGRPARGLIFNSNAGCVFIIKEETKSLEGAVLNLSGDVFYQTMIEYNMNQGYEKFIGQLTNLIDDLYSHLENKELWGIGFVIRGVVIKNKVYMHSQFKNWGEVDLYNRIYKKYNIKPYIINYPNAAAKGEIKNDEDRKLKNILYINWGMSIGMGIIINRKLYTGSGDISGEIGHIVVDDRSQTRCYCGKYGCLEAVATGKSLINDIINAINEGVSTRLQGNEDELTISEVIKAGLEGDKLAYVKLKDKFRFLGKGLAVLTDIFDPDTIIIGGDMIAAGDEFFDILKMNYMEEMMSIPIVGYKEQNKVKLEYTKINNINVFFGGVALILEDVLELHKEK